MVFTLVFASSFEGATFVIQSESGFAGVDVRRRSTSFDVAVAASARRTTTLMGAGSPTAHATFGFAAAPRALQPVPVERAAAMRNVELRMESHVDGRDGESERDERFIDFPCLE
jgi:acyl-CoA hydrolase